MAPNDCYCMNKNAPGPPKVWGEELPGGSASYTDEGMMRYR